MSGHMRMLVRSAAIAGVIAAMCLGESSAMGLRAAGSLRCAKCGTQLVRHRFLRPSDREGHTHMRYLCPSCREGWTGPAEGEVMRCPKCGHMVMECPDCLRKIKR